MVGFCLVEHFPNKMCRPRSRPADLLLAKTLRDPFADASAPPGAAPWGPRPRAPLRLATAIASHAARGIGTSPASPEGADDEASHPASLRPAACAARTRRLGDSALPPLASRHDHRERPAAAARGGVRRSSGRSEPRNAGANRASDRRLQRFDRAGVRSAARPPRRPLDRGRELHRSAGCRLPEQLAEARRSRHARRHAPPGRHRRRRLRPAAADPQGAAAVAAPRMDPCGAAPSRGGRSDPRVAMDARSAAPARIAASRAGILDPCSPRPRRRATNPTTPRPTGEPACKRT